MALVVFLRGVNVGGHRVFRPAQFARDLKDYDAVNVGAAGTFVVRASTSQADVRSALTRLLPFETEAAICPGREICALVAADPFAGYPAFTGNNRFVTILGKAPGRTSPLAANFRVGYQVPPGDADWQIRVIAVAGRFVLSVRRDTGERLPNLSGPLRPRSDKTRADWSTTRNWNTILTIARILAC